MLLLIYITHYSNIKSNNIYHITKCFSLKKMYKSKLAFLIRIDANTRATVFKTHLLQK